MTLKICCSCKEKKEESLFSKSKNTKDGLKKYCKDCARIQGEKYKEKNKDKVMQSKRDWYEKSKLKNIERTNKEIEKGYRVCTICRIRKNINEFYKRGNGGFYGYCKACQLKIQKEYHLKNREKIILRKRQYNNMCKDRISQYNKKYYIKNSVDIKNRVKEWNESNKEKSKNLKIRSYHIREARKRLLLNTYTKNEWEECKKYFNNEHGVVECAYCGKEIKKVTQEHFIPISKGGNYTRDNIIPACGSCNSSKCDKTFEEWYPNKKFYSEERKNKIYTYLKSVK
ncbi:HNH endonuclease [Clostridioides difficile]|nr:HNH endonuclease [Clostridioides difficile]